jgi:pseudaminic acid synthase
VKIGDMSIGRHARPLIVAEMSGNHNQSLERALEIVDAAARAGAHALKLQTYTADTMTLNINEGAFLLGDQRSPWSGRSLHELYQSAHTPWEWHAPIMECARSFGMLCFSSAFDKSSVEFLESLDVAAYKIASFEITDLPLIRKVASTGKPMIISTGMAKLAEIDSAVGAARGAGCTDLVLLKCTSDYPASPENTNILTIPNMREVFDCEIGLSDHTMGIGVAVASVGLGATLIEKHFTLRRADGGVDSKFSIEPDELRSLVIETERAWQALGTVSYGPTGAEIKSLAFRRSLYIVSDLKAGDQLTVDNLRAIRPGFGLAPCYYESLLGMAVSKDVPRGSPATWDLFK